MSLPEGASANVSLEGTRSYYHDVTRQYGRYSGAAAGWHYGVWDAGVTSHQQSLLRSNERLLEGLSINASTHILDAGCGGGGFATWAAAQFGCKVTGITLVPEHTRQASELAAARAVSHLCRFEVAQMDYLPYAANTFDVVVNQDSCCHAVDKPRYLKGVLNVLRAGGHWRAIDFSVQHEPLSPTEQADYREVLEGFQIPGLISPQGITDILHSIGFDEILCEDITTAVLPSARYINRMCRLPSIAMRLGLDWTFFGAEPAARRNRQGHVRAGAAYSRGLIKGYFRHGYYSARKHE